MQLTNSPVPHFEITAALFAAMGKDEVWATIDALKECGQLCLPYPIQTVTFDMRAYVSAPGWGNLVLSDKEIDTSVTMVLFNHATDSRKWEISNRFGILQPAIGEYIVDLDLGLLYDGKSWLGWQEAEHISKSLRQSGIQVSQLLVAALATKNVVKQTSFNKRAARGIGNGKFRGPSGTIYLSRTRLDVPHEYNETGRRVRFHLRRGHYHTFRIGKDHAEGTIKKFIPALLVNKDLRTPGQVLDAPKYEVV